MQLCSLRIFTFTGMGPYWSQFSTMQCFKMSVTLSVCVSLVAHHKGKSWEDQFCFGKELLESGGCVNPNF